MSVCVSVTTLAAVSLICIYTRTKLLTALTRYSLHLQLVDFASFRSYGVVCYSAGAIYRLGSAIEVTSQALRNAQCWRSRSEVAIGVQVASFVLDRGFSEFYRSSTVSLYCRTLVAVSTSVQIRQTPSTFHPEHQVCM